MNDYYSLDFLSQRYYLQVNTDTQQAIMSRNLKMIDTDLQGVCLIRSSQLSYLWNLD